MPLVLVEIMAIYIGNFIDENLYKRRGLPTRNAAASNRMFRIARALSTVGVKARILTPATALRLRWRGRLFHHGSVSRCGGISVIVSATIGLPLLSSLSEIIVLPIKAISLARRTGDKTAIFYCYYPSLVITALLFKLNGIRVVADIEDLCIPKWADFRRSSEASPLQQVVGWVMMKLMCWIADSFVVPTKDFVRCLPKRKPNILVDGCIDPERLEITVPERIGPIFNVLYAGAIEDYQGAALFAETLMKIDRENGVLAQRLHIRVCGHGSKSAMLADAMSRCRNLSTEFCGSVTGEQYKKILDVADICLVLPDPRGRYADAVIPSKFYEYLAHGKFVVVSNVISFASLPVEIRTALPEYTAGYLLKALEEVDKDAIAHRRKKTIEYTRVHWSFAAAGERLKYLVH